MALPDRSGALGARAPLGRPSGAGEAWQGFDSVRVLPDSQTEILLVPLAGHTHGHAGVAVPDGTGWLLHCGDAYFHHDEVTTPPRCPSGLRAFQNLVQADGKLRRQNQERCGSWLGARTPRSG